MSTPEQLSSILKDVFAPNVPQEQIHRIYDEWAAKYDTDLTQTSIRYACVGMVVERAAAVLGNRWDARILDLGAGTGLVGQQLAEKGYRNIDALDANVSMLAEASKKKVYREVICDYLGTNTLNINDAEYDVLILVGAFVPNHVNDSCFEELIRILKPGGHFVFGINKNHLATPDFKDKFEDRIRQLEVAGRWRCEDREVTDGYLVDTNTNIVSQGVFYTLVKL